MLRWEQKDMMTIMVTLIGIMDKCESFVVLAARFIVYKFLVYERVHW